MKRAVILFPCFSNTNAIQKIREKYDPLANLISPHITIVFPFDSDLSADALRVHFNRELKEFKRFQVQLKGFTGDSRDGYLFLNVKKGNDHIIELHDRLYSGILKNFLCRKLTYCPHLTVGRLQEEKKFGKAIDELSDSGEIFEAVIDKIYVENIDVMEKITAEFLFNLE